VIFPGSTPASPAGKRCHPLRSSVVLSRSIEVLKQALKVVSDAAVHLKDAGFDELTPDLRTAMSKIRKEMNHREAVKDHPDLFG
jgi:hypothetical protein